jgi:hypothetical protein
MKYVLATFPLLKQVKNELKKGGKIMVAYDGSEISNAAVDMG